MASSKVCLLRSYTRLNSFPISGNLKIDFGQKSHFAPTVLISTVSCPTITRKTDKGIPRYRDQDLFIFMGEDLTPLNLDDNGDVIPDDSFGDFYISSVPKTGLIEHFGFD